MKIGIVSDGKFGDRAYEIIREKFPTEWIMAPFPSGMMVDDIELTLPDCDLYISYVRHPDVALAIIDKQKPVILGVSFGPGFLRQAKGINENIVAPPTMCSLEDNTWVPEIIRVLRGSPCGSTVEASKELPGTNLNTEQLQHYGLRICHFCRAPRLGKTCDKEAAGVLHIRELIRAIGAVSPAVAERVKQFSEDMEEVLDQKMTRG